MQALTLRPIGVIRSPFAKLEDMPIQPSGARGARGEVELDPACAEGLDDLEGFSHLFLLYHFHRSKGFKLKVKPFLEDVKRGLFATRAPARPNPVGLSVVRLVERKGNVLLIEDVDVLDGTPLLDVKPVVPDFDAPQGEVRTGWLEAHKGRAETLRSDDRFKDEE